jgi:hypothetical protein
LIMAIAVVIILLVLIFFLIRRAGSKPVGTVCMTDTDCNSGLVCDTTLRQCRAPIGTVCTSDDQCSSNAVCTNGMCTVKTVQMPVTTMSTTTTSTTTTSTTTMPLTPSTTTPNTTPTALSPIIVDYSHSSSSCDSSVSITPSTTGCDSSNRSSYDQLSSIFNRKSFDTTTSAGSTCNMLDIVELDRDEIILLTDNRILYQDKRYNTDKILTRLEVVGRTVYGISSGHLVVLISKSLKSNTLVWDTVDSMPKGIIHTSSTRNGSHLWLQTKTKGFLYNTRREIVDKINCVNFIRNYGSNSDYYIDSYPSKDEVIIYAGLEQFTKSISYAIFNDDEDGIIACTLDDWKIYKDIRLTCKSSYMVVR